MTLQAVMFDLGGTLIYNNERYDKLLAQGHQGIIAYLSKKRHNVLHNEAMKVSSEIYSVYHAFCEKTFIELTPHVLFSAILYRLGINDSPDKELIKGIITSFYNPIINSSNLSRDVCEILSRIKKKGLKLGLVTNNHSTYCHRQLLQKFNLEKYFDAIVVSSECGVRKPHKRIFLHCLKQLSVDNKASIFIGDSPLHDVQGAQNVGMRCIWMKRRDDEPMSMKPDWIAKSFNQIEEIVYSLL